MNLSDQVCSLELSKRLHELGVEAASYFAWYVEPDGTKHLVARNFPVHSLEPAVWANIPFCTAYPAYTVGELGAMLPECFYSMLVGNRWDCYVDIMGDFNVLNNCISVSTTEADCRAKALIYCIENGHIKIEDINNEKAKP